MRFLALFTLSIIFLHHPITKNYFSYSMIHVNINITNLLTHYINACGFGYLCDYTMNRNYRHVKARFPNCPPCRCDDLCFIDGNCCPDKYFNARNELRSVYLSDKMKEEDDIKMNFIDKCPDGAPAKEQQECEKDLTQLERLFLPPCTSSIGKKIYWNKHCALCHKEREETLDFWGLYVSRDCSEQLFYLSSWEEILTYTESSGCVMRYNPPGQIPSLSPYDDVSDHCKDGSDGDITNACMSSYNVKYRSFRSIFCAMCNPFSDLDRSAFISSCHYNGPSPSQTDSEWQTLKFLCYSSELSSLTYPYKNVFCYMCNVRFSARQKVEENVAHYADGTLTVRHSLHGVGRYAFNVYITEVNIDNLTWIYDDIKSVVRDIELNNLSERDLRPYGERSLNISHLARVYYASLGAHFCDISIVNDASPVYGMCACDPSCIFGRGEICCFETMVKTPYTCLQTYDGNSYLVINGCSDEKLKSRDPMKYTAMEHLCNTELDFPVVINKVSYRNIFCLLCNEHTFAAATPWSFILRCQAEIPLLYHMTIIPNIIKEARKRRCIVDFDTSMAYRCSNEFTQCTYFDDQNIVEVCEHTGFKFLKRGVEFCDMCRQPPLTRKSNCTPESPYYSPDLQSKCAEFPEVNHYEFGDYKNVFCFKCNVLRVSYPVDTQEKGTKHPFIEIERPMQLILSNPAKQMQTGVSSCYPGRGWSGKSCEALLQYVTRAKYILNMILDIHIGKSTDLPSLHILKEIKSTLEKHVEKYVDKTMPVLLFNLDLYPVDEEKTSEKEKVFKVILVVEFELVNFDRTTTEKNLFDLQDVLLGFKYQITRYSINFEITRNTLPVSLTEVSIPYGPRYLSYLSLINTYILQGLNFVSELLFCEHKVIKTGYHYDSASLSIKLDNGLFIPLGEFIQPTGGVIHICNCNNFSHPSIQTIFDKFAQASVIIRYISLGLCICSFLVISLMMYFGRLLSLSLTYLRILVLFITLEEVLLILVDYVVPSQSVCCVYSVLRHYFGLLVALSLFFYGKSVIYELKFAEKGDNPIQHFYRVIVISPIVIIVTNSICLKVITNDFGYCDGSGVCFLHVFPSVILSLYLPRFITLIGLCVEFYKVQFRINRIRCALFCFLSANTVCEWVFEALYLLKYVESSILKSILCLFLSVIVIVCISYSYLTSRRQASARDSHEDDQVTATNT